MKKVLFTLMILATALPLFSVPIDETTANHYAKTFWQKNHIAGVINGTVIFQTAEEARFVNYANHAGWAARGQEGGGPSP